MDLVSAILIDHFRSVRHVEIPNLASLTAFTGLNNSGKSNMLRALNLFFTGEPEPGLDFNFADDYFRPDIGRRTPRKTIEIAVTFTLPAYFRIPKGLAPVQQLLGGASFTLSKQWTRGATPVQYALNGQTLVEADRLKVDQFLSLITFRYVPNRVLPLEIIENHREELRDALVHRLATNYKRQDEVFVEMRKIAGSLIDTLAGRIQSAPTDVGTVSLATPASWREIVPTLGYRLTTGGVELDDRLQGSGIQSLLMLETLALIDRDSFQKFGWKQASVWAVEEPESSLHTALEVNVAAYLADLAKPTSRTQIFVTTHSDVMVQLAQGVVHVTRAAGATVAATLPDRRAALDVLATEGVARWVHPLLANPRHPVLLVEGKQDQAFISQAFRLVLPQYEIIVSCLEELRQDAAVGGVDSLVNYLRDNRQVIAMRAPQAPIAVLLDWDASGKRGQFERYLSAQRVNVWPETAFNPRLDRAFRGIERHMSDRIIQDADAVGRLLGQRQDETYTVGAQDYASFKQAVYAVLLAGITANDLTHARDFLLTLGESLTS